MPDRTVAHAAVTYATKDDVVTVRRGYTHDFPQSVIDRHEPYGAFTAEPGLPPAPPGVLEPLRDGATAEEVASFVEAATAAELLLFTAANPWSEVMVAEALAQIVDARQVVPVTGSAPVHQTSTGDAVRDASKVVEGTVADVAEYLADHPEESAAVLDAETKRSSGDPRQGVVNAAEAAAALFG